MPIILATCAVPFHFLSEYIHRRWIFWRKTEPGSERNINDHFPRFVTRRAGKATGLLHVRAWSREIEPCCIAPRDRLIYRRVASRFAAIQFDQRKGILIAKIRRCIDNIEPDITGTLLECRFEEMHLVPRYRFSIILFLHTYEDNSDEIIVPTLDVLLSECVRVCGRFECVKNIQNMRTWCVQHCWRIEQWD